ncbi:hypothetical protein QA942_39825 [Streptomyces sp. B21-106]|uniref:hypothetical protein n=1 Tax=Streptomyces sp. B21-106 TaxID=3039418 RepID=UPI002FF37069
MTVPHDNSTDPYANTPTAMVYDVFAETANELIGLCTARSDAASDPVERDTWWQRALTVRDVRRSVPAQDRQALLRHIAVWKADAEALKAAQ